MEQEIAIEFKNVSKSFKIYLDKSNTLKDKVLFRKRNRYAKREVLKDVSFSIRKGEAVGLIGHNGCGKSTTLKLLTRIIYPDQGTIDINGRVSSLLELGAGFHPDMSGRENIYNNASIFGLTKKEIDKRIEDIISFSELEEFIDNPVRTYSSGMYMRLAFSVAINVDAEILLIDEILAVGDANFQLKCAQKMQEIKKAGTTIVIVSHSMEQIESLCDRTIWLDSGEIVEDGVPHYVHKQYLEHMGAQRNQRSEAEKRKAEAAKALELEFERVECRNREYEYQNVFVTGDDVGTIITYKMKKPQKVNVQMGVFRSDYMMCYEETTKGQKIDVMLQEHGVFELWLRNIQLLPGHYMIDLDFYTEDGNLIKSFKAVCHFNIYPTTGEHGIYRMEHEWNFKNK